MIIIIAFTYKILFFIYLFLEKSNKKLPPLNKGGSNLIFIFYLSFLSPLAIRLSRTISYPSAP